MEALGRPDVVVHCAGIMPLFPIASGECVPSTGDRDELARNVPDSLRRRNFRMAAHHAFSSSVLAKSFRLTVPTSPPGRSQGMVHVLANELRGRNITVNAVAAARCERPVLEGKSDALIDELRR